MIPGLPSSITAVLVSCSSCCSQAAAFSLECQKVKENPGQRSICIPTKLLLGPWVGQCQEGVEAESSSWGTCRAHHRDG